MAITRRITTTVDEFDNSTGFAQSTDIPPSLKPLDSSDTDKAIPTNMPSNEIPEGTPSTSAKRGGQTTIGRTYPDLVIEFINNQPAIATLLAILSFIIYIPKIDINNIAWLKFPAITAAILNILYFGVAFLISRFRQRRQRRP